MIRLILKLYIFIIILDTILSYLPQFRYQKWAQWIKKAADYSLAPVRKILPPDLPIDPSPLIVIVIITILMALW
jgi:YggT family protein